MKKKEGKEMGRYQLEQSFVITDEENRKEKECRLSFLIHEDGMRRGRMLNLLEEVAGIYRGLLKEEREQYKREEKEWRKRFHVEREIKERILQQRKQGEF